MNIEEFLDEIDAMLDKSWGLPGGKSVVDAEKMRAVIDDIRLNMPQEIKQARSIVADRVDIINNAKRESENIIRAAEERARALVSQEEITKHAQARASEIISQAQSKGREMRKAAQDFVDDIMKRADESITANLSEVRKTRSSLRQSMGAAGGKQVGGSAPQPAGAAQQQPPQNAEAPPRSRQQFDRERQ